MHSLVFGLFQQGVNPAGITPHQAKGAEMPEGCGDHTRNGSRRFEEDDPLVKWVGSARGAHVGIVVAYSEPLDRIHSVPAFS